MLRFGDDELKRAAMEVCKNAILFNEYIIAGLLNSRDLAVRQFGIQIIEDNLQEYGLSFQELWPKWEMSANNSYESRRVGQNLKVLYEVERMRAGSAKLLIDRYGINCFGRYTPEILVAQCEIHEREIPYGVVIVSRHDHSGTFYGGAMSSFLNQIKQQLGDTIGIRIIECGDKGEIARSLYALDAEYGDKNKISFCIVIAHGNGRGDGLVLGPNADKPGQSIKKKDFENRRARLLKDCFVAGFETVFFSCETGVEDGLAQGASRGWDMSTTGPQEPFATADVTVSLDDNNLPHFTMAFDGGKPAHRYSKGSPEKHT